jgi:hypothetical protein
MSEYENLRTADILAEALIDWKVNVIIGLPHVVLFFERSHVNGESIIYIR